MNEGKISIRYSNALYALAVEQGKQERIYQQMETLAEAFLKVPKMTDALCNPMFSAEEKFSLLRTAGGNKDTPLMDQFLRFVIKKGREEYMVFIAMTFLDKYRKEERIVLGKITSTIALPEETLIRIKRFIKVKYRQKLELTTEIDKKIIGGFIMEVSNYKLDASVKAELEKFRHGLISY